ncbi:MAG: response regulator [Bacillota bacterium]
MAIGKKVLIVEDEILIALSLGELLEYWSYELCEPAASGEDAVRRAESEQPDIILMDVNIRGRIDGIQAAREITSRFNIPIIFMSGYSQDEIRKKAGLDGVVEFMSKPMDHDKLRKTLESMT